MFVMVKCGVVFEVWAEFIVKVSSGFKDLWRFSLHSDFYIQQDWKWCTPLCRIWNSQQCCLKSASLQCFAIFKQSWFMGHREIHLWLYVTEMDGQKRSPQVEILLCKKQIKMPDTNALLIRENIAGKTRQKIILNLFS
jgi:hypothetical protein